MESDKGIASGEPGPGGDQAILMESAFVTPGEGGESPISRGMPVVSTDGHEVGWVAAVVTDSRGASTGVLLARPKTTLEYYLLAPGMIRSVNDGQVLLGIRAEAAWSLPQRNAGTTP